MNLLVSLNRQNDGCRVTDRSRSGPVEMTAVPVTGTACSPTKFSEQIERTPSCSGQSGLYEWISFEPMISGIFDLDGYTPTELSDVTGVL
jgi:hypothetical protein